MFRFQDNSDELKPLPEEYLADPRRYFDEWVPKQLAERDDLTSRFGRANTVAQINLIGDRGGKWHFVLGDGRVELDNGEHAEPTFTVTMPVDTWRQMRRGEVTGLRAFLQGQLKVKGSKLKLLRIARLM